MSNRSKMKVEVYQGMSITASFVKLLDEVLKGKIDNSQKVELFADNIVLIQELLDERKTH